MSGAGTKNRTRDLLITNQLLYHLSYAGMMISMLLTIRNLYKKLRQYYFTIFRKDLSRLT
ncbi:MAG: hypothetical protein RI993_1302 [Pseudomonadota bacterium]